MRLPVGLHAAIQFHVRCNLKAFRLTKSITQSCGACAFHPHNNHCFCLLLCWLSGRIGCMHGCLFHMCSTLELSSVWTLKQSSEVRHELLQQSPQVTKKNRQDQTYLHLKQKMFQGLEETGLYFSSPSDCGLEQDINDRQGSCGSTQPGGINTYPSLKYEGLGEKTQACTKRENTQVQLLLTTHAPQWIKNKHTTQAPCANLTTHTLTLASV